MRKRWFVIVAMAITVAFAVVAGVWKPEFVQLWNFGRDDFLRVLTQLIAIALIIERAVEVLISPLRSEETERRRLALAIQSERASDIESVLPYINPYVGWRSDTQKIAFSISLGLGLLVAIIGMRALQFLADPVVLNGLRGTQATLFRIVDVVLTGALLAGGADGLHKLASLFTSYVERATERVRLGHPVRM
ncbi:MAG TPA: hypothetical protein VN577_04465 [Terriglobales bacterium]|nr:hypothetical protein [Terriglobales bacterium]